MTQNQEQSVDALGAATEQLRAALEREAVEVMKQARAEARNIEETARRRAGEIEQEARKRALSIQSDRGRELTGRVDALEETMRAMLDELRDELRGAVAPSAANSTSPPNASPIDRLAEDMESAPAPPAPVQAPPVPPPPVQKTPGASAPLRTASLSMTAEAEAATERSPELDAQMRAQIMSMRDAGRTRGEAERFLSRFRSGDSYAPLLDEIYPEHEQVFVPHVSSVKRRRFGRRRA